MGGGRSHLRMLQSLHVRAQCRLRLSPSEETLLSSLPCWAVVWAGSGIPCLFYLLNDLTSHVKLWWGEVTLTEDHTPTPSSWQLSCRDECPEPYEAPRNWSLLVPTWSLCISAEGRSDPGRGSWSSERLPPLASLVVALESRSGLA